MALPQVITMLYSLTTILFYFSTFSKNEGLFPMAIITVLPFCIPEIFQHLSLHPVFLLFTFPIFAFNCSASFSFICLTCSHPFFKVQDTSFKKGNSKLLKKLECIRSNSNTLPDANLIGIKNKWIKRWKEKSHSGKNK